jgi:stearoyl-CoA desaturase (delta-9 desaturase)
VDYHRLFTHGSFRPRPRYASPWPLPTAWRWRPARTVGSRPPQVSRRLRPRRRPTLAGRFDISPMVLARGMLYATSAGCSHHRAPAAAKCAPDLLADRDIAALSRWFAAFAALSLLAPAVAGGPLTWSWHGAASGVFLGGTHRFAAPRHLVGELGVPGLRRPAVRLARQIGERTVARPALVGRVPTQPAPRGPTCARHGALPGQLDPSAALGAAETCSPRPDLGPAHSTARGENRYVS